jgi:hypothetical protein
MPVFIIHQFSHAYGMGLGPQVFVSPDLSSACKQVLQDDLKKHGNLVYRLFDTCYDEIEMRMTENLIYFTLNPKAIPVFKQCIPDAVYDGAQAVMTYNQFAKNISNLKYLLVEAGIGDDPFPSFLWNLVQVPDDGLCKKYVTLRGESYEFTDIKWDDPDNCEFIEQWPLTFFTLVRKIQRWWRAIYYNPYTRIGRDKVNRDYDFIINGNTETNIRPAKAAPMFSGYYPC